MLLATMAVVRLDEETDDVENVLSSTLMDRKDLIPSKNRDIDVTGDPLASSTWEKVSMNSHLSLLYTCVRILSQIVI